MHSQRSLPSLRLLLSALLLGVFGTNASAKADLAGFMSKPEPEYKWSKTAEKRVSGGTIYDLHLVSQVWQGHTWEHRLVIFRPDKVLNPHFCTLLNTGGNGGEEDNQLGMMTARGSENAFAILFNIPNQPLYNGLKEDALIAYTWQKFLETGDESWPLHFPMAKSVLKAMDAVQAFTKQAGLPVLNEFLITGASKRGWTTWLVGASGDRRVKAIAPMVIDTLNVIAQIPHQLAAFGKPSEQVGDYTSAGFMEKLKTEKGRRLMQLEDPYSYRDVLTLPKLLILGTNDRYWSQDALNLYWDGLKGPKWVMYDPNSGHGLEDRVRLFNTLTAFARCQATNKPWPKMKWAYKSDGAGVELSVRSDIPIKSAALFHANAPTQDFRDSKWTSHPMKPATSGFIGRQEKPDAGYTAVFGEVSYEIDGRTFTLSTQIRILGGRS